MNTEFTEHNDTPQQPKRPLRTQSSYIDPNKGKAKVFMPLVFAFIMMLGMLIGMRMQQQLRPGMVTQGANSQLAGIGEVFNYIDSRYVDPINSDDLAEKVIKETLEDLDPHSSYISAKDLPRIQESMSGNFDGIGIEFSLVKDTIVVVTPIVGGPSEKLGILSGDKIIQIEDTLVAGINITNDQVMEKLKGERGTYVKVGIYRKGKEELLEFDIRRSRIPLVSVEVGYLMDDEVGYMKVTRFSATTFKEFKKKLNELKEAGMKKLILDLRQNPGGYLDMAVNMVDEFIPSNRLLVYTKGRNHKRREFKSERFEGNFENGDLVILIDEGSASASEIVAGAIQDWDRGKVVGRRSFGKGLVQEQETLSNGAALRLTVARYYTPSGRCIQKPYGEDTEAYDKEIEKRLADGELFGEEADSTDIIADSLKFQTLIEGRTVLGGGGITPDIFVPYDSTGTENFLLSARGLIPEFVYDYFSNNRPYFEQYGNLESFRKNFQVNEQIFSKFRDFTKKEVKKFDAQLFQRDQEKLKTVIKAHIARQLWNNDGYYPVIHDLDKMLQTAHEELKKG